MKKFTINKRNSSKISSSNCINNQGKFLTIVRTVHQRHKIFILIWATKKLFNPAQRRQKIMLNALMMTVKMKIEEIQD